MLRQALGLHHRTSYSMGHLSNLAHLSLGERRIGGDCADRRVAASPGDDAVTAHDGRHGIAEALPLLSPGASKDLAGVRMVDVADGIHQAEPAAGQGAVRLTTSSQRSSLSVSSISGS